MEFHVISYCLSKKSQHVRREFCPKHAPLRFPARQISAGQPVQSLALFTSPNIHPSCRSGVFAVTPPSTHLVFPQNPRPRPPAPSSSVPRRRRGRLVRFALRPPARAFAQCRTRPLVRPRHGGPARPGLVHAEGTKRWK